MVGEGGSDPMDFHALEAMQCMMERRKGGETGVKVGADDRRRRGLEGGRGRAMVEGAAECGSFAQRYAAGPDRQGRAHAGSCGIGRATEAVPRIPPRISLSTADGLKTTLLMLDGAVKDFNFAARVKGMAASSRRSFFLTPVPNVTYSACLVNKIEEMFATGVAPYPVERTLIVSGMLESCLTSKVQGHQRLETPHLSVKYQAPAKSQFAQS